VRAFAYASVSVSINGSVGIVAFVRVWIWNSAAPEKKGKKEDKDET
jgi:hypothetical protein